MLVELKAGVDEHTEDLATLASCRDVAVLVHLKVDPLVTLRCVVEEVDEYSYPE
jgi:hypothetical protein